ncbi:MAG: pyridoxamine 5'-phosphate oxidase family protein [Clostridium sp.]|uniref:pyridoxamine 5'-phosphate oxidase family protein n=1 Tax=Clostridium sp. TaxID=1506 RepID=UPI0029062D75|nr:pyridoxamine 5'-phosphate oxidase family protein [Clostridium sp.]MDU7339075.1 pyridoxamine 5'-phosphate oxidase family protein [Clostridium sp.]
MDTKKEFTRLMATQSEIALATCVENQPNVRIVNFYYDEEREVLYFTSFADNEKVKEFESNNKISFTTIPHQGNEHIKAQGCVKKSSRTIFDIAEHFIKKIPDYKDTIEQAGQYLILFEITFDTAMVTLDFENIETYTLAD